MSSSQYAEGGPPPAPHSADMPEEGGAVVRMYTPPAISKTNEASASVLGARVAEDIRARTLVAINRPRDVDAAKKRLLVSCEGFRFADAAMYAKPIGKNKPPITGLSVRFAEEAARQFGNLDISVMIVSEDDERRVLEGVGVDLETNYIQRATAVVPKYVERLETRGGDEVVGQRTNSRGKVTFKVRANDDALHTITQAAAAKLRRDVTLLMIPWTVREECEEAIERTLAQLGDKDPEKFVAQVIQLFATIGVAESELAKFLGGPPSQMNVTQARFLRRIHQGIKQGEGTWKEVMEKERPETPAGEEKDKAATKGGATEGLKKAVQADKKGKPCPTCARTDGTHDPEKACFADA